MPDGYLSDRGGPAQPPVPDTASLLLEAPGYFIDYNGFGTSVADLNGDGNPDMVIANENLNEIAVLLGNGDGTFQPVAYYPTGGSEPSRVTVGDFNGDGIPDVAVSEIGGAAVLLGNGDGTFQPYHFFSTGINGGSGSIETGDFNGDGKLDLAVVNPDGATVSILLGNGDGTFQTHQDYATGTDPLGLVVGDFDDDGKLDLAVSDGSGPVSILLGNGNGTFQKHVDYPACSSAEEVASGDLNGDGAIDLAVTCYGANVVSVLLGNGNGTFKAAQDFRTEGSPNGIVIADLNGDGRLDVAVANVQSNSVSVLFGKGDGTLESPISYGVGIETFSLAVGDFNRDGHPDLAATSYGDQYERILLNNGDGTFFGRSELLAGRSPRASAVGDFNGDGKPDLAVVNNYGNTVSVFLGTGNGQFQAPVFYPTMLAPLGITVGDFNGDGRLDLAVTNSMCVGLRDCTEPGSVTILLGKGDGTFRRGGDYVAGVGIAAYSIAAGDFNHDGKLDLAVANFGNYSQGGSISVLLGKGDGTFKPQATYFGGYFPASLAAADLNGDGKLDLAVYSPEVGGQQEGILAFLGNGDGTFQPYVLSSTGTSTLSFTLGDLNGDGKLDAITANGNGGPGTVSVMLGNGDGTFQPQVNYETGGFPSAVAVADFNGDGKLDVVEVDYGGRVARMLLGNGDGTLTVPSNSYQVGDIDQGTILTADLNGDGQPDLVTSNSGGSTVSVLLNTTGTSISLASSPNPSTRGEPVTFTATVAGSLKGEPIPTGVVKFYDGATKVGKATLSQGVATLTYSSLSVGRHFIAARYLGDSNFNVNKSKSIVQVVNK
jgi:hypothetical protein